MQFSLKIMFYNAVSIIKTFKITRVLYHAFCINLSLNHFQCITLKYIKRLQKSMKAMQANTSTKTLHNICRKILKNRCCIYNSETCAR